MIHPCKTEEDVDRILEKDAALIFKHSTSCGASAAAYDEIKLLDYRLHDTPIYLIRVIQHRAASNRVEERLGVPHESPQVIFVRNGKPVWELSHREITVEAIREKLGHES